MYSFTSEHHFSKFSISACMLFFSSSILSIISSFSFFSSFSFSTLSFSSFTSFFEDSSRSEFALSKSLTSFLLSSSKILQVSNCRDIHIELRIKSAFSFLASSNLFTSFKLNVFVKVVTNNLLLNLL